MWYLEDDARAVGELLVLHGLDDDALRDVVGEGRQLVQGRDRSDEGVRVLQRLSERAAEEWNGVEEAALLQDRGGLVIAEVAVAIVEVEGVEVVLGAVPDAALHHGGVLHSGDLLARVGSAEDLAYERR